jgi:hypothetical protein
MSREARRVPANWQHPTRNSTPGRFIPLYEGGVEAPLARWEAENAAWEAGTHPDQLQYKDDTAGRAFAEWYGDRPKAEQYMPAWPEGTATHWQMYETTTEGTPISPIMESPEALARWLADNGASAFADQRATYEQWLATITRGGSRGSFGVDLHTGNLTSGVALAAEGE